MFAFKVGDAATIEWNGHTVQVTIDEVLDTEDDLCIVELPDGSTCYAATGPEWGNLLPAELEYSI